jgi:teichuronic acid biosynthesis glycosyltransferase TuaG
MTNNQQPLVSVIVPTYNREHYITKAITSITSQSYTNWELLIIDDGSTDTTETIIKTYTDPRIRYYYQKMQDLK